MDDRSYDYKSHAGLPRPAYQTKRESGAFVLDGHKTTCS